MQKFLEIIGVILLIIIGGVFILLKVIEYRVNHYYNYLETEKNLEKKYSEFGEYEVSFKSFDADSDVFKKYEIWYPTDLENSNKKYPLIVVANGTGITASKYKAFFKHLASWGFVVIGNEDENSRSGESSSKSLDYVLKLNQDKNSIFYNKIDTDNIGIGGHSQGGVGTINAVNNWGNGKLYKAMYTASATSPFLGQEGHLGTDWAYDVTKINIPYFFIAGTEYFDAGEAISIEETTGQGICPLYAMKDIYSKLTTEYKVMGRLVNVDHGATYQKADGYMTAWFMYWLKDDLQAGGVFFEEDSEILTNANWQDVKINK
ncbi:alpha/beta hydrolase [Clostridium sp. DSM 100503]|uniref:poly(ethylene terephthalate) hydrolase family protein n=1 Tax=Clostridium sp. DSM 100503 TaxID=2963282 RepID=UPI002149C97E|nr:alpha/beta hydrolase [Clostridium sp. DSM 100503]MCR1952313.1 alpha/beta hydrolase [Clostridium sp. DSM 100503]